jgi:membrane-associated phospholipid phosphatase
MLVGALVGLKHLWHLYREGRPRDPLRTMLQRLVQSALAGDRIGSLFHGLVTFTPLITMFVALKGDITRIHPFSWDRAFMNLGLQLGFGQHYWQILQPVLGHPPITAFLSIAYALWFPVLFGCLFWQLTRPTNDLTRSQYLLSFAFAWFFGGFVLATVFSSAGPCYYEHVVGGPNPYGPLLHYLRVTSQHWPVWTIPAQDTLWHSYVTGVGDVEGISAMPSMHVTIATLMALVAWRTNRNLGIAFSTFAFIILIGSIMLGWHYSADGLAGIALGYLFWTLAGKVSHMWARDRDRLFARPARGRSALTHTLSQADSVA